MISKLPSPRRLGVAVAVSALLLTACGSGDDATDTEAPADTAAPPDTDGDDADDGETDAGGSDAGGPQENGPVEFAGPPLDPYDSSIEDLAIGTPSPVVTGESFDGSPIAFGGPTDRPTMVVFLAHWCPHCNDEIPELLELQEDGRLPTDLDVIGVSTAVRPGEENYPPSQWIEDKQWAWPVLADDEDLTAIAAAGGTSFPFVVVLDTDGTVLARRAGQASADDTVEFLETALASRQG